MFNPLRARYAIATLFGLAVIAVPQLSVAQIAVSITIAPPPLPVYEQPPIPDDGYIWAPGYWSYGPDGYFWVPGTWVQPPEVGLLWTPGYWGWTDGAFVWNAGYWGPHIGFYGGVNYGFGYVGHGYEGGYWQDNRFFYNRNVNNVTNVTNIRNVYTKTVVNNVTVNNISYNGGNGGVTARPTNEEQTAARETHRPPTSVQTQHRETAGSNRALLASVNQGKPEIAATAKPGQFSGAGVVKASRTGAPGGAPVVVHAPTTTNKAEEGRAATAATAARPTTPVRPNEPAKPTEREPATMNRAEENRPATASSAMRPAMPVHPSDLPKPAERAPVNSGNAARDQQVQKQQADLQAKHDQERQALQQKQTQEHEQLTQQKADAARTAAVEQQHQQQTQQLQQRHAAEQRTLTHAQPPKPREPQKPPAEEHKPTSN